MSGQPLEETFAGCAGRWRVVDKGTEDGRDHTRRFAVMALPVNVPFPTGIDDPCLEFELCAVQYRPHAEAIAALPELSTALLAVRRRGLPDRYVSDVALAGEVDDAIAKAEGRAV